VDSSAGRLIDAAFLSERNDLTALQNKQQTPDIEPASELSWVNAPTRTAVLPARPVYQCRLARTARTKRGQVRIPV
jgi:hypothetical protein